VARRHDRRRRRILTRALNGALASADVARRDVGESTLVVFDCDGVLVDSEPISNRVMAAAIAELGLTMPVAQVASAFQGKLLSEIAEEVERQLGGTPLPGDWLEVFEQKRAAAFREELEPVAGAREILEALEHARLARCVATQASRAKAELTLGLTGLRHFFADDALFSSRMVARGKPHPDVFLLAARTMGHAPERCVVVEDGVGGALGARAAGMTVLGYAPDGDGAALREAGAAVFSSMSELPALLGLARAG
jgi:HAD superfamily hydrolase (TIGR01509 family)